MEHFDTVELELGTAPSTAIPTRPGYYPEPQGFRGELKRAQGIYRALCRATDQVYADVRVGRALSATSLDKPMERMIDSIIRHPDAMVWMCRLHPHPDNYWVGHAVRTAALAAVLGRSMGLAEAQLRRLAMGGLLCQIGKTKLPMKLLEKSGPLQADELDRIRNHVQPASELLRAADSVKDEVIEIIENHQERFNGTGIPGARQGDQIPALARLLGMVEWFDSMISIKPYTDRVLTPCEAMDYLYQQRDVLFPTQLVEEFVRAVGVYPNGTLVELNTGEVAVVQAQNSANRTQPRIVLVRDHDGKDLPRYRPINMMEFNRNSDVALTIRRALPADEFQMDAAQLIKAGSGSSLSGLFSSRVAPRFLQFQMQ
ncbi:MAG: HD domain-containing phosphohydrolase [Xanthomonadales bacterium]|nr:HD domain-containing phosphohydrolase [Xanthomonadales bacterium]